MDNSVPPKFLRASVRSFKWISQLIQNEIFDNILFWYQFQLGVIDFNLRPKSQKADCFQNIRVIKTNVHIR